MGLEGYFPGRRRLVLAALIVAGLVAFVLTRPGIAPAGPAALLVNSTANTSDGQCDGTNCTLREAIDAANTGASNTITFDPSVFPPDAPAVIDMEGGAGVLPSITADITIDATGAGVVLDGDTENDGTAVAGLKVDANHDGFSFAIVGDNNFTIRDITGRAINIVGNTHALDTLSIDGITISNTTDDGIFTSGVTHATHISLTNSTIDAGDFGIGTVIAGPDISSLDYVVTGNDIRADSTGTTQGPAVGLNMQAALAPHSTVNYTVENNDRIEGRTGAGVSLTLCSSSSQCALDSSDINLSVTGNALVTGGAGAVVARVRAAPTGKGGTANSIYTMLVNDNDTINGGSKTGIDVKSEICCGTGNQSNITVDGNGEINALGGDAGTDIRAATCCDSTTGTAFEVSNNTGPISSGRGPAIGLEVDCCGTNSVNVEDNAGISSTGNHGIQVQTCVTHETLPLQDEIDCVNGGTKTVMHVTGNVVNGVHGDGIHICCGEFKVGDQRSVISNNTLTNSEVMGIDINSSHGIIVGPGNVINHNGADVGEFPSGIRLNILSAMLIYHLFSVTMPTDNNTITENQISENGGPGIDLVGFSPAANPSAPDELALEYGVNGCNPFLPAPINANDCLAAPALTNVTSGALRGTACGNCHVEVYSANDQPQDQGTGVADQHGEGETFLVAADAASNGSFAILLPCGLPGGILTTTATDAGGNTSEFSLNLPFLGTSACVATPTATPTHGAATPTPTRTPAPTPTTPAAMCGDVNGDHSVNSIDSALVLQYSAGLIQTFTTPQGADVNHDGATNSIDAALILQNTAGLLANLNC